MHYLQNQGDTYASHETVPMLQAPLLLMFCAAPQVYAIPM